MKKLLNTIHHIAVPSHRNNYRAKALQLDFLVVLVGIVAIFSLLTGWAEEANVLGFAKDIRIEKLYELTNQERTSQGLPPLKYNNQLALAAQKKADHMFSHDYWAHFGAGKSPWDFIVASGYSYEVAGENLAKGFMFSEGVLEGWRDSPTHYANIVRPEYDEIGFAVRNGVLKGEETTLVVQMFGAQIAQVEPVPDDESTQIASNEPVEEVQETEDLEASGTQTDEPGEASEQPSEEELATVQQPVVASSFISLDRIEFNWSMIIIGFLLIVLTLDLYFAHRLDIVRLSGKNVAHIIFLSALALGLVVIKSGVVLGMPL